MTRELLTSTHAFINTTLLLSSSFVHHRHLNNTHNLNFCINNAIQRTYSTRHRHKSTIITSSSSPSPSPEHDTSIEKPSQIKDGPFGRVFIHIFRSILQPQIQYTSPRNGYDGMIEEMRTLLIRQSPTGQQKVVFNTLNKIFQAPYGTTFFRKFLSDKPQLNARLTPAIFSWLVGPCEFNKTEEGLYSVDIEKCRFLDEGGCKGLCVNMCQQPTQRYFTDVLGLPVRLTPDYEDNSCQMTFGQQPLALSEDPAVSGDCVKGCKMAGVKKRSDVKCYVNKEADPFA